MGQALQPGALVLLQGPLGAGKTTFAQGVASGLGVPEAVVSPTFVLVREYELGDDVRLVHMDFYRLTQPTEAVGLGLEDYLAGRDIVLIEWPENGPQSLRSEALVVELAFRDDSRQITLYASGEQAEAALAKLRGEEPTVI